ncbi:MAG: cellulose biosynthesis cyclic di-GMP-binding regulatory protein BcsB [Acidobacteria bacterium]|nr:cellulose biosynthesis cyclic di-GMP-binding regulatory protein BcsB [Acidobacteriota bacterium]
MKRFVLALAFLLAAGGLSAPPLGADSGGPQVLTLKDYGYDALTVRGVFGATDFWMPGPGPVSLVGASRFRLHYRSTDTLLPNRSTLTVRLNGLDIASAPLSPNAGDRWLDIALPTSLIDPNFNRFEFNFFMRYDDAQHCSDPYNPALWATIFPDSYLEYGRWESKVFSDDLDLARYPSPFLRTESGPDPVLSVVSPQAPDAVTLTGMASLMARLGQLAAGRVLHPTVRPAGALPDVAAIIIGRGSEFPWLEGFNGFPLRYQASSGQFLDASGEPIAPEVGVLQVGLRPRANQPPVPLLLVSGGSAEGVSRAALALSSRSFSALLHGRYALITNPPDLSNLRENEIKPGVFSFGDLTKSASDLTVRGRGTHAVNIPFSLPQGWRFEKQPQITLHFSHADGLDDRSLLTVEVNGAAVGSTRLTSNNANGGSLSLAIPPSALRPGLNSMALVFEARPNKDEPCEFVFDTVAWGTIHRDSTLDLSFTEDTTTTDLSVFAAPFIQQGIIRETSLLLPPSPGETVISQTLTLAARLGARTSSDLTYLPVLLASDSATLPDHHLILLGLPGAHPLLAPLALWLPIQFDDKGALVSTNLTAKLLAVQNEQAVGVIQIGDSPWQRARRVLVISGNSDEAISWAIEATARAPFKGNIAILTSDTKVTVLTQEPARRAVQVPPEQQLPIGLAVAAVVVVALFLAVSAAALISGRRPRLDRGP